MQTISQTNVLFTKSPVNSLHCCGETMEEQQLEHVLPSAPVGAELTHVWKVCNCMREKKRQQ